MWSALAENHQTVPVDDRALDGLAFGWVSDPFSDAWCVKDRIPGLLVKADHCSGLAKVDNLLAKCKVCHMEFLSAVLPLGKVGDKVFLSVVY